MKVPILIQNCLVADEDIGFVRKLTG